MDASQRNAYRKSKTMKKVVDDNKSHLSKKQSVKSSEKKRESLTSMSYIKDISQSNFAIPTYEPEIEEDLGIDQKITILKEPSFLTSIPTIDQDKQLMKENNGLQPKPVDTFLEHSKSYAATNMKIQDLSVPKYQFGKKDFKSGVLNLIIIDKMMQEGAMLDQSALTDEEISLCFLMESMRLFLDFFYCNKQQYFLVKTWQKVTFQTPSQRLAYQNANKGGESKNTDDKKKEGSKEKVFQETTFFIKTFQVFDKLGGSIGDPILVEQVFGNFDDYRLYDTSILQNDGILYYFKRLYEDNPQGENPFAEQSSSDDDQNLLKSISSNDNGPSKKNLKRFKKLEKQKQFLQLFSYDVLTQKETLIKNIKIEENEWKNVEVDQDEQQSLIMRLQKKISLQDLSVFKPQYNIQMSKQFGPNENLKNQNELQWLQKQFFAIQKYTQNQEANSFRIYKINEYQEDVLNDSLVIEVHQVDKQFENNHIIRQIQCINHIQNYSKREDDSTVNFIITNMFIQVQIQYDFETNKCLEPISQYRKSTDIFQRIWNNGGIIPQMSRITQSDGNSQKEDFDQYFYVDSRNQIQLLFPSNMSKVEKLKLIEIIGYKNRVTPLDFNFYKKITCIYHNKIGECNYRNTIQNIEHLKYILGFEQINSAQSLTYLKDDLSEVLLVSEPSSKSILLFQLQDSNQILCSTQVEQLQENQTTKDEIFEPKMSEAGFKIERKIHYTTKDWPIMANGIDHEEPYLKYQQKQGKKGKSKNGEIDILKQAERKNHVLIDDFNGQKLKVKTHHINQEDYDDEYKQQLRLILCQQTQGNEFILFLFVVQNSLQIGQSNDAFNDQLLIKRSYIFVRKSYTEMNEIFTSMCNKFVVNNDDIVLIMKSYNIFEEIKFKDIKDFQFRKELDIMNNIQIVEDDSSQKIIPYEEIKLVLSKVADDKCKINFVPMVYQQKQIADKIKLLIYDISKNNITQSISVSPTQINQEYMYEDEQGYKKFMLCRTSAMSEELKGSTLFEGVIQRAKYQFFTLYQEKVGRIMCEEFLVVHEKFGARIQTIGQKHIILSQQLIQDCEWIHIRDSQVVPFYDDFGSIKGCQLMLKINENTFKGIKLCDQDMNKIYTYKSSVLITGKKKFIISEDNLKQYVMVLSSQMRKNIIIKNLFDRSESYIILQRSLDLMLTMRVPDLEFLVLNSFEDLKNLDFFQSQEILLGKSICEICLNEPDSINKAVKEYDFRNTQCAQGSVLEYLTINDQVRKQSLILTKFYPKQLLLQIDLNLVGTIKRAIEFSNYKSLKILFFQVMSVIDSIDYQPIVMFDLPIIMDSKQLQINDFFNISKTEKMNKDLDGGFCNLEIQFKDPDLPVFNDKPFNFIKMVNFENFLQFERDILNKVIDVSKLGNNNEKTHEIEYYYIDFTHMIIGEKMRTINSKETIKFNDLYYSNLMVLKCDGGESLNTFFAQETIQKIIDSQWRLTKDLQQYIFIVYLLMYCVPMCVSSFKITNTIDLLMFVIALLPASMLTFIEAIQLYEQGWSYFQGWNIIDSSQIFIYGLLFTMMLLGFDNKVLFFPELKLINIILAFMKILFFIRIYEKYGFLVQMIVSCVQALVPFIISYITFLLVFAVCYVVLENEIDPGVDEAEGLSYFQKTVLQTFRTAIGELGMPKYEKISAKPPSVFKDINIYLIWMLWFIHTFFMLVIMLNFLIAVISSNYEQTMIYQKLIGYRHKAELNYETYMLINFFTKIEEYKCIVFQCSKSSEGFNKDEFDEKFDSLKKFMVRENKRIMNEYNRFNENMQSFIDHQAIMDNQANQKFFSLSNFQNELKDDLFNAYLDQKKSSESKQQ